MYKFLFSKGANGQNRAVADDKREGTYRGRGSLWNLESWVLSFFQQHNFFFLFDFKYTSITCGLEHRRLTLRERALLNTLCTVRVLKWILGFPLRRCPFFCQTFCYPIQRPKRFKILLSFSICYTWAYLFEVQQQNRYLSFPHWVQICTQFIHSPKPPINSTKCLTVQKQRDIQISSRDTPNSILDQW